MKLILLLPLRLAMRSILLFCCFLRLHSLTRMYCYARSAHFLQFIYCFCPLVHRTIKYIKIIVSRCTMWDSEACTFGVGFPLFKKFLLVSNVCASPLVLTMEDGKCNLRSVSSTNYDDGGSAGGPVCEIYSSKRAVIDVLLIESRCKSRLLINRLLTTTLPMVINDPSINHLTAKNSFFNVRRTIWIRKQAFVGSEKGTKEWMLNTVSHMIRKRNGKFNYNRSHN